MKSIRTSPKRRSALASAFVGALVLGTTAAGGMSFADEPDHPEPGDPGPVVVAPPTQEETDAALNWENYEKILITKNVGEPIDMAVLPDKRIVHTARNGELRLTDPAAGTTSIVNTIPVYANSEDGLQVIELDPNFEENNYVYVVYAPLSGTPTGNAPNSLPAGADPATYWNQWLGVNRLSRFEWTGNALDLASEQPILDVTVQRGQCCHVGADIDFDADGNLYLSTGDNTPASTPGANGFAPNNNAPGLNPGFDARRGAGNTNDLRGKILRINVNDEIAAGATPGVGSTYTIPAGNLFAEGTANTRPEIFVMGVRNPFRMDVDPVNNVLTWGDYGPDASAAAAAAQNPPRGPMGLVEWNVTKLSEPINAGWPYVHGNNFAYNEWDFATATPGAFFDPANLKNNSTWNTGLVDLPPAVPAKIWYGDNTGDADQPFDEFTDFGSGSGQGPMGGPTYHFDPANPSTTKLPSYWHNKNFFGEFSQDYIAAISADWETLEVQKVENFLPNGAVTSRFSPIHDNPMDLEFGPDGSLYVLEYGDGFFRANPDSGLYRIDYAPGNKSPTARFTAQPISSTSAPLTVNFDATTSVDPERETLTYEWDLDGNGSFEATGATVSFTYTTLGQYTARLRVTDPEGKTGITSRVISVGNQAPTVSADYPGDGSFFQWGDHIPFRITTNDAEDGTATTCARVAWTYGLGHDEHAHPESSGTGCTGVWRTDPNSPNHGVGAFLYGAVVVTYTDNGANGLPAASGELTRQLNPFLQEAENAITRQGVVVYDDESASGGRAIRGLGTGDFLRYSPVNFAGVTGVNVVANGGGAIQFRWGAADAAPFATATVPSGAGWKTVNVPFTNAPTGSGQLFITSASEVAIDALDFTGDGVADVTAPTVTHTLAPAAPTGVGGVYNVPVTVTLNVADNGAIGTVQQSRDGGATWQNIAAAQGAYRITVNTNGAYNIQYRATDSQGNVSQVGTVSFTVDLSAPNAPTVDSTTVATVPAATVTFGAPGSVNVTVSGAGGTPSGQVILTVGDTQVGTGTLAGGTATIALPANLPVGAHVIKASYGADGTFKASAGTVRLNIAKSGSVVDASVSPNPVKPAVSAKVSVHAESTTGVAGAGNITVLVKRGISTAATVSGSLDADGNAVITLPKLTAGSYTLTVTHAATANTHASSKVITLTVKN